MWDTHKRLFEKADGKLPGPDQGRLTLIGLLPPDISSNVIMEMEKPGFESFSAIKKYALKLVKVLQNQKRQSRGGLNLVDAYRGVECEDKQEPEYEEEEVDFEKGIAEILALDFAPDAQAAEINAFVIEKFVRRGPAGGVFRGRPEAPGCFQAPRSASAPVRPPPRDRADVKCMNCNRKGHTAQDCRQQRVDKDKCKCFLCDGVGFGCDF